MPPGPLSSGYTCVPGEATEGSSPDYLMVSRGSRQQPNLGKVSPELLVTMNNSLVQKPISPCREGSQQSEEQRWGEQERGPKHIQTRVQPGTSGAHVSTNHSIPFCDQTNPSWISVLCHQGR